MAGRDQNFYYGGSQENRELNELYRKLKEDGIGESSVSGIVDKLQHYFNIATDVDVRGLEEKFKASNRSDMLQLAISLKEKAAMSIMKRQTSRTAQRIFLIVLEKLYSDFILKVTPLIQNNQSRVDVDEKIQEIIENLRIMLGENVLEFTELDLLGLVFFLGGNCHVRWDKC